MKMKAFIYLSISIMLFMASCTTTTNTGKVPSQGSYQCVGKVLDIQSENIGRGGAKGRFEVSVVKIRVTSSTINGVKAGDAIHCELIANPQVKPVEGREYVFKAKSLHPAHAKGVYLLDTEVMDLTR